MKSLRIKSLEEYDKEYKRSVDDTEGFWAEKAESFDWRKKWDKVMSGDFTNVDMKWFEGGKLNITENCLDRHLKDNGDKTAVIFEPNDPKDPAQKFSFKELHAEVCKFSNVLQDQGVKKGDRVCLYMAMTPHLLISVLACARIGAVHSVVFAGFSPTALAGRIIDATPKVVITNNVGLRGTKEIPLKTMTDEALESCPSVEKVVVYHRNDTKVPMKDGRDLDWDTLMKTASAEHTAVEVDAEDPLFILYTSGSTGQPKGIQHTTAGYMVYAAYTFQNVFQIDPGGDDVYWCTADIGWITGHTYLTYGPLLSATTTVMFEGIPTYPDAGRFWDVVKKNDVTHFYTAPTAIRALQAAGDKHIDGRDLSTLKVLGSVGEPINIEAWNWYNEKVGNKNCPIVDSWWQTETGGIMITPMAGITKLIPCHATKPLPGVQPVILDDKGVEQTEMKAEGLLCMKKPWPGIVRTIYGDHERCKQTYFSSFKGYYFTGDGCKRDEEGNYRITGRVDDVINVSGHRMGTAEVEDAINQHPNVVESAVVGYPHEIKGQGIFAYITRYKKDDTTKSEKEIKDIVTKIVGPIAKPDRMLFVTGLPKTRSGKIMRRILRKVAEGDSTNLGDISTLLDPSVVEEIIAKEKEGRK